MKDYKDTPSFFNNSEVLKKYLGDTSYYTALRYAVKKIVKLTKPKRVVELGSATGATTLLLAKSFKKIQFYGSDIRDDVAEIAEQEAKRQKIKNASFGVDDMCAYARKAIDADLVFLLYSFHHILDPIKLKEEFLSDMYCNMKQGAYLCIAETFIPEEAENLEDADTILRLWKTRAQEGGASTFWHSLSGLSDKKINLALERAEYCSHNEALAGELVAQRKDEYLMKRSWVAECGEQQGFEIIINQPVNALGDGVVLLRRPK